MEVFNETPYLDSHTEAMYEPGRPFMSVVVKGTLALVENGPCAALPRPKQTGFQQKVDFMDVHGNAPKTPGDMAPFKMRGEWLFIGSAHSPGGVPVDALEVAVSVGRSEKKLSVYGNRHWIREADGSANISKPEPFVEQPIRAEYGHGGLTSKYNMHGIGHGQLAEKTGTTLPVANIQNGRQAAISWERDAPHAGYGMLSPNMLPRRALLGTFDGVWLTRRRPLPPADFDPAFWNAAPEDQQIDGYFRGDEEIVLRNLHPDSPIFRTALPGTTVRCFVKRHVDPAEEMNHEFTEIRTVLDTCIIDVPGGTVTLLWRGTFEIEDRRHRQVEHLLLVEEPVGASEPAETYAALLQEKLVDPSIEEAKKAEEERQKKMAEINKEGLAAIVDTLKKGGGSPALIARIEQVDSLDEAQRLIAEEVEKFQEILSREGGPPTG